MEATQESTDGWMDQQNMVPNFNRIFLSVRKEGHPDKDTSPWRHYAKWINQSQSSKFMIPLIWDT